ncbi:hypothetical protein BDW22DRAFT_1305625, partial [Trametopsis cervina]
LSHPEQVRTCIRAHKALASEGEISDVYCDWPLPLNGLAIISNRQTPLHRDKKTAPTMFDFLATCGTYGDGVFTIADLDIRFRYAPGTMIALCGGALRHMAAVDDGERVVFAGFMRREL